MEATACVTPSTVIESTLLKINASNILVTKTNPNVKCMLMTLIQQTRSRCRAALDMYHNSGHSSAGVPPDAELCRCFHSPGDLVDVEWHSRSSTDRNQTNADKNFSQRTTWNWVWKTEDYWRLSLLKVSSGWDNPPNCPYHKSPMNCQRPVGQPSRHAWNSSCFSFEPIASAIVQQSTQPFPFVQKSCQKGQIMNSIIRLPLLRWLKRFLNVCGEEKPEMTC